jgi:hypothetical protein
MIFRFNLDLYLVEIYTFYDVAPHSFAMGLIAVFKPLTSKVAIEVS